MGYNKYGKADVDPDDPRAFAVCDRCGIWDNLYKLNWQMEWNAASLYNKRLLVCNSCLDKPNDQFRVIVLPPDPLPVLNARPEKFERAEVDYIITEDGDVIQIETGDGLVEDEASENFED